MLAICVGFILGIPLLDLGIKFYIEKHISRGTEIPTCKEKILIRHVHNEGMALNFLERYPTFVKWVSAGATILTGVYVIFLMGNDGRKIEKISLSMLLGGAISNVYDRIVRKYVVDYFGFKTKWKRFSDITFNLGDMFIFAGSIGIVLISIFKKK